MIADIQKLLSNLSSPGILQDLNRDKSTATENISDINSGQLYQRFIEKATPGFLHLTATLNTDGVNLYASSKVEPWPVFLAINELSPVMRFARENILLVGLWQGKGKPHIKGIFHSLSLDVNSIFSNGLDVHLKDGDSVEVTLSVLCVTLDLPAKAAVLNMTYYNCSNACITCEEPGITVKQGRGHSKCYPYRDEKSKYPQRTHASALEVMQAASPNNRLKGFKGMSGLNYFQNFDIVSGTVPDYMHAVLLGITHSLMSKWFSPSESGEDYFIGKQIKQVSQRLMSIKPPFEIEDCLWIWSVIVQILRQQKCKPSYCTMHYRVCMTYCLKSISVICVCCRKLHIYYLEIKLPRKNLTERKYC